MKRNEIEAKLTRPDRQIAALQNLLSAGMKIVVSNSKQIAQLTKNLNTLVKALERGRNGSRNPGGPASGNSDYYAAPITCALLTGPAERRRLLRGRNTRTRATGTSARG